MKRYKINNSLKSSILKQRRSLRSLNKDVGFEIRNILYKNSSINEDQLRKLEFYVNKKFRLKRIYIDYGRNLGKLSIPKPIKPIYKGGDLAEFMGIMLGDGNIWNNRIRIAFDKRKIDYVNYVSDLFKKLFEIELKKEINKSTNQLYLYCNNLFVVEKLLDYELKRGHKIKNNLGIPDWIKNNRFYSKRCIKGLIDTDGCIYWSKRDKQTYIKFTNFNLQLLKDFKEITVFLGYHFARANKNNWCLYRKIEVANFIKDIKPFNF
jgi:hypothetical protein